MRGWRASVLFVLPALIVATSPPALAQNPEPTASATLKALERLDKALRTETGLALETRDALHGLIEALRAERKGAAKSQPEALAQRLVRSSKEVSGVGERPNANVPSQEKAPWEEVLKRLNPYADFRLRAESNVNLDGKPARHRQRVRFRVGANYQMTDELFIGARITSGNPADPQSPHETFGNAFHSFNVSLDRAFVNYRPGWLRGTWLTAGKFGHPFYRNPVYGELVWDADVQPEGLVAGYTLTELGRLESLGLTAGEYVLLEQSRGDEGTASVFQVSGRVRLSEHLRSNVAASYYLFSDVTPSGSRAILGENGGNTTIDRDGDGQPDDFGSRFAVLNPIVGFTYDRWRLPLTLSAEYILNTRARVAQDQGWAVGTALGRARQRGDWRVYYQWQVIEQDAVFSPFAQDDFLFATNHRSHVFGVNNQLTNRIGLHLWGLVSAENRSFSTGTSDSAKSQWRLRLDLNVKF